MLNHKYAKFYLMLTRHVWFTWDLNIEKMQITSQILLKGHKMLNFLFTFFLKIFETLKAHITGTEADINKQ